MKGARSNFQAFINSCLVTLGSIQTFWQGLVEYGGIVAVKLFNAGFFMFNFQFKKEQSA